MFVLIDSFEREVLKPILYNCNVILGSFKTLSEILSKNIKELSNTLKEVKEKIPKLREEMVKHREEIPEEISNEIENTLSMIERVSVSISKDAPMILEKANTISKSLKTLKEQVEKLNTGESKELFPELKELFSDQVVKKLEAIYEKYSRKIFKNIVMYTLDIDVISTYGQTISFDDITIIVSIYESYLDKIRSLEPDFFEVYRSIYELKRRILQYLVKRLNIRIQEYIGKEGK